MKKLFLFLPLLLLFSCSVQKRKYQNGYYVNWHGNDSKKEKPLATTKSPAVIHQKNADQETSVLDHKGNKGVYGLVSAKLFETVLKKALTRSAPPEDTCDVLVYKDGAEIRGKVQEVGINEIKYKRCDTPDGPTYISRKSELFMIKYANGTREVIKSEATTPQVQTAPSAPRTNNSTSTNNYRQERYKKQVHPLAIAALIFGIMSIVISWFLLVLLAGGLLYSGMIFAVPFLAALVAVVTGKTALNRISEQPDVFKGKGLALPGFIMGMVILGIYITVLFFILLFSGL